MRVILRRLSINLVILLGLTVLPTPLWADVVNLRLDVLAAQASFFTPVSAETGCLFTLVNVQIIDDLTQTINQRPATGKPLTTTESEDLLSIQVADTCTFQIISRFVCSSDDASGSRIRESLGSATLATTMTCTDALDPEAPTIEVPVDITWSATGEIIKRFDREKQSNEFQKSHSKFRFASRSAVASGTVMLGGTNLIPGESEFAELFKQSIALHALLKCRLFPELCEFLPLAR